MIRTIWKKWLLVLKDFVRREKEKMKIELSSRTVFERIKD